MIKRYVYSVIFLFLFMCAGFLSPTIVSAIDSNAKNDFQSSVNEVGGSEASGLPEVVVNTINIMLYVAGVIAVIIIVIGALRFVTSEGDAASANKAKNSIAYALVGLVLAALSYALVNFILSGVK